MKRSINILAAAVVLLLCFYVFYVLLAHQLFFHEQQSLFRFDGAYFCELFSKIGGAAGYFGAFVSQFFKIEWLGALLLAGLVAGLYGWLSGWIARRSVAGIDGLNWAMVPAALQIILFTKVDYTFELLWAFYLTLFAYTIWCWGRRSVWVAVVLAAGLYPLIEWYSLWLVLLVVWEMKGWWKRGLVVGVAVAAPLGWAWIYFRPAIECYRIDSLWPLYGLGYWGVLLLLLRLKIKRIWVVWGLSYVVWIGAAGVGLVVRYDVREKQMIEIDRAIKQEAWERVIHYAEWLDEPNVMVVYARNLALLMLDRLPQELMRTPQRYGIDGLFIGRKGNRREMEYMDEIYARLGLYNEAHRQAWESMTNYGLTASNAPKLVHYNMRMGREAIARKFDRLLDHTLFYRGTLDRIKARQADAPAFESNKPSAHFTNVHNIGADLNYMFMNGAPSKRSIDCLLVALLLNHKVEAFGPVLGQALRYYPNGLPMLYQQGLIVWREKSSPEALGELGVLISPQAERQYAQYAQAYPSGVGPFADTYYFYLHFVTPYSSKRTRE